MKLRNILAVISCFLYSPSSTINMTESRALLGRRVNKLKTVLHHAPTPLLRRQIHEAIRRYRDALEAFNFDQDLEDLNTQFD